MKVPAKVNFGVDLNIQIISFHSLQSYGKVNILVFFSNSAALLVKANC